MWNIYPRPQLKRNSFFSLNGEWEFCEQDAEASIENVKYNEKIQVPFVAQSELSGIGRLIPEEHMVCYKKNFTLPENFLEDAALLRINFGAVDQRCLVYLNGKEIGKHSDGYTSFSCLCPEGLLNPENENQLEVFVWDTLSDEIYPRGKQKHNRGGMWYTPCTGIWQTVWLEAVPAVFIDSIRIDTGLDYAKIRVLAFDCKQKKQLTDISGEISFIENDTSYSYPIINGICHIHFDNPRNWSPEDPFLYNITINVGYDIVESYLGLRSIRVGDINGIKRILINNKPVYFHGVLDQGYYPEGIFTPDGPEKYINDIDIVQKCGFNTIRKHIKVEPEVFYHECDKRGVIVFQDMINNGSYNYLRDTIIPTIRPGFIRSDLHLNKNPKVRNQFLATSKRIVNQLYNHPCICYWTIFNEGWGQFTGNKVYDLFKSWDKSRIIDTTSGWFRGKKTDVLSIHEYFKPIIIKPTNMPVILSEYGGYVWEELGHLWNKSDKKSYGYKNFKSKKDWENSLLKLLENTILRAIPKGLCGDIYTQLSDVEDEINGLITYDREVIKPNIQRLKELAERMYKEVLR